MNLKNNTKKRFHFCTKEFLKELQEKSIIYADNRETNDRNKYAYDYIFFKEKKINNGNGMFFIWKDYNCKGNNIKLNDNPSDGEFVLLELNIPSNICIDTDYDNWCSFIMDLDEADGNYDIANEICLEYGIKDGLEGSYKCIYDIDDNSRIQTLIPYFDINWISNIKYTNIKVI